MANKYFKNHFKHLKINLNKNQGMKIKTRKYHFCLSNWQMFSMVNSIDISLESNTKKWLNTSEGQLGNMYQHNCLLINNSTS